MNPLLRYWKFNLVGAMGMVVQLAALALINRCVPGHYLVATAAAIELALLHNFVWHLRFTWRDRRGRSALLPQLVRFHLANGLVSMLGNLALMRILVHGARSAASGGKHDCDSLLLRRELLPGRQLGICRRCLAAGVLRALLRRFGGQDLDHLVGSRAGADVADGALIVGRTNTAWGLPAFAR